MLMRYKRVAFVCVYCASLAARREWSPLDIVDNCQCVPCTCAHANRAERRLHVSKCVYVSYYNKWANASFDFVSSEVTVKGFSQQPVRESVRHEIGVRARPDDNTITPVKCAYLRTHQRVCLSWLLMLTTSQQRRHLFVSEMCFS